VLSEWTAEALAREIEDDSTPGFFLLSNIRCASPYWRGRWAVGKGRVEVICFLSGKYLNGLTSRPLGSFPVGLCQQETLSTSCGRFGRASTPRSRYPSSCPFRVLVLVQIPQRLFFTPSCSLFDPLLCFFLLFDNLHARSCFFSWLSAPRLLVSTIPALLGSSSCAALFLFLLLHLSLAVHPYFTSAS